MKALLVRHFGHEEAFLEHLGAGDPKLAAKLRGQHEEVLEIVARLEESMVDGSGDEFYLVRRLLAITEHNMIEEERDVFGRVG